MIYLIVLLLLLLSIYAFDYRRYGRFYYLAFWAFFIILVFIAGLRYRIGTDSIVYERVYKDFPKIWELAKYNYNTTRFEPGFILFASIPRSISSDFTLMQFFQATVVNLVIFWFILKNTSNRFLCLTFYYIILYLNFTTQVMRESLAVCAFLLAWPFLRDGKWLKYYAMALLAVFLHTSAILLLLIPLLYLPGIVEIFRFGKKTIFICIGLLVVGFIMQSKFYDIMLSLSVSDRMADRANEYSKQDIGGGILNIMGTLDLIMKSVLYPWMALYFTKNKVRREKDPEDRHFFKRIELLVVLGIYLTIVGIPMFIFTRYYNYLAMFQFVLIASCFFHKIDFKRRSFRIKPEYWFIIVLPFLALNVKSYYAPINKSRTLRYYMIYEPYVSRLDPYMISNREAIYRYYDAR